MRRLFLPGEFTGQTESWTIADTILSEVRHVQAKAVPRHEHVAPYFSLLLGGSYQECSDDFNFVYQPYSLIFHAAHTPHEDFIGESGCRMFFIELLDTWSDIVDAFAGSTQHVFELDGSDPAWIALRLHREFLERDSGSSNAVESLLYELLAHIGSRPNDEMHEPEWLLAVEAQLRGHFASRVSLRELAGTIGVNPAHLCRAFRRFRGRTIGEFTTNLRVQFVCRRLTDSDDSLSTIAHAGGFTDQSHMTRIFKRATSLSPGAYRKKN